MRINATPSDLPFKSTGLAIYPEPPQFGQLSGSTLSPPRVIKDFPRDGRKCFRRLVCVTKAEQEGPETNGSRGKARHSRAVGARRGFPAQLFRALPTRESSKSVTLVPTDRQRRSRMVSFHPQRLRGVNARDAYRRQATRND